MLSYDNFKSKVTEEINSQLAGSKDFSDWVMIENKRFSINRSVDFLEPRSVRHGRRNNAMLPSFRFISMYNDYVSGFPLESIAEDIADILAEAIAVRSVAPPTTDIAEKILDPGNIYIALINRSMNEELLKTVPHVDFLDLAVIFRFIMPCGERGEYVAIINNDMQKDLGKTTEELLSVASANSMRDYEPVAEENDGTYRLTADSGIICSHALACDQLLYDTACQAESDLYIVPVCLAFCVAFPDKDFTSEELFNASRNMYARLREEDRLSDGLYHYDRAEHKLTLCEPDACREKDPEASAVN